MATGAIGALLLCAGWQGSYVTSRDVATAKEAPAQGMDAGVPRAASTARPWQRGERVASRAIATRQLSADMLAPEAPPSPIPPCRAPDAVVPATAPCGVGAPYPECRWRLPEPPKVGAWLDRWRNTDPAHWWGRPSLVTVVLAAAQEYARLFPGERLTVGDLDAAGPRHATHDQGRDVDLYLPGDMESENAGMGAYPSNYRDRPRLQVRMQRARVEALARVLTSCTDGAVRIYYNDRPVAKRFLRWFRRQGFASPFGTPMQAHNALHRFHFHVTITEDQPPLPGPVGLIGLN